MKSKLKRKAEGAADEAKDAVEAKAGDVRGPSPNPMTNLMLADIALRGGTQLVTNAIERLALGQKYAPGFARKVLKGRSMKQTLISTALSRVAMRSVPGAILVGGAMLAKTLYDRGKQRRDARGEGDEELAEQARKG